MGEDNTRFYYIAPNSQDYEKCVSSCLRIYQRGTEPKYETRKIYETANLSFDSVAIVIFDKNCISRARGSVLYFREFGTDSHSFVDLPKAT